MHKYIINDHAYLEHELLDHARRQIVSAPDWEKHHWNVILNWLENPAFIQAQTSGTTGTPKVIEHSGRAVRASAMITSEFFDLRESDLAFLCLPSTFIGGKMMILRALIHGWQLDWCEPGSFPFHQVKKHYDFTAITPHQCAVALQNGYDFKLFKHVLLGGAEVNVKIREQLKSLKPNFYLGYAMTETLTHVAMQNIKTTSDPQLFECLGKTTVSTDDRGCLVLKVPHLDKPLTVTNDLAECLDDKHFRLLGRMDHVINSGGIKIFPSTVENLLEEVIRQPFYITSKNHDELGQAVVLKIEGTPWTEVQMKVLHEYMEKSVPKFMRPKEIIFVDQFEYTQNQKVIKR
ncbi:MAG: hypothetical protein RLZZ262_1152 [Bacteroidota bacterium]|jgi:o-succinylbenzoate---CoA ligase